MIVANPIYDIVFKYLMEDERIARTILSALLKQNIVKVEVRPHEYTNSQRDKVSIYRIDFGATVRDDDDHEHLILIELQKTWLETETLRFRQYLGVQYQNPQNVVGKGRDKHALPLVAVYLLGHKVGDIEEPVLYVKHQPLDYNGNLVSKGLPNAFVDSLTHDSIIVQIPRLNGVINNRLYKVLSIFDQTYQCPNNQQMLELEDQLYDDDADMQYILHRLLMATADAHIRQDMNVEDEYYSIIEKHDTEIMMMNKEIAEKTQQIDEQAQQLDQQAQQLDQQAQQLDQQAQQFDQQAQQIAEQAQQMDNMRRQSVVALLKAGQSPSTVANILGISPSFVQDIAKEME